MTQATKQIRELEPDDRLRVTLDDGTELRCMAQNDPDEGPPLTPDGEAAGWEEKWTLAAIHVEADDGTGYETLDLSAEKRGGEWGEIYGQAWTYSVEDDYVNTAVDIDSVEPLSVEEAERLKGEQLAAESEERRELEREERS